MSERPPCRLQRHRGSTPPFRTSKGEVLPGSIAGYQRLGGLDQWVMIRGENIANPPLILLHGGPGFSEMRLFRHFNAPLEKGFTVVYWTSEAPANRPTAKSRSSMTVEQFIMALHKKSVRATPSPPSAAAPPHRGGRLCSHNTMVSLPLVRGRRECSERGGRSR